MAMRKYLTAITAVSVNEYVTVVRYRDEQDKHDEFDVYLEGKLLQKGLSNYEAHAIGKALVEAYRAE